MSIQTIPSMPKIPKIPTPMPGGAAGLPSLPKIPNAATAPKGPIVPPKPPVAGKIPTLPKNPSPTQSAVKMPTVNVNNAAPILPGMPDPNKQEEAVNKLNALKQTVGDIQEKAKEEETSKKEELKEVPQEAPKEEAKDVKTEQETGEGKEAPKDTSKEEGTTRKRGRKSKKETAAPTQDAQNNNESKETDKAAQSSQTPIDNLITIQLKPTCKDFKVMEEAICNTFNDPEWEKLKEELTEANSKIIIETDMNATTLKMAVSDLSKLRNRILAPFYKYQTNFQNLVSDKPEGILERVKRINSKGANDYERRRSGVIACMQYEINGELINLYELLEQTRERYNFLKSIMDSVEYKTKALITMNSAILMEQKLEN